jgi:hypothetical protein
VAAMVLAALLVIEFEHFAPSAETATPPPTPDEPPAP